VCYLTRTTRELTILLERCVCHQPGEMVYWHMTVKALKEAIRRAETWPDEAQEELAEIAMEIDAALKSGAYDAYARRT
jgi:hypothetical protein